MQTTTIIEIQFPEEYNHIQQFKFDNKIYINITYEAKDA